MKWCEYCKAKTLKKSSHNGGFIFDMDRMAYFTKYNCTGLSEGCYGSYIRCVLCEKIMSAGKLSGNSLVWVHHIIQHHPQITIQSPFETSRNLRININIDGCMRHDYEPALLTMFPQLIVLSVDDTLTYYIEHQEEILSTIYADIRNRNYSCKLCSMEYDSFPTLKVVHNHVKKCVIAARSAAAQVSKTLASLAPD